MPMFGYSFGGDACRGVSPYGPSIWLELLGNAAIPAQLWGVVFAGAFVA
jgi:hypothetical protein